MSNKQVNIDFHTPRYRDAKNFIKDLENAIQKVPANIPVDIIFDGYEDGGVSITLQYCEKMTDKEVLEELENDIKSVKTLIKMSNEELIHRENRLINAQLAYDTELTKQKNLDIPKSNIE